MPRIPNVPSTALPLKSRKIEWYSDGAWEQGSKMISMQHNCKYYPCPNIKQGPFQRSNTARTERQVPSSLEAIKEQKTERGFVQ